MAAMRPGRRKVDPPLGLTGSPRPQQQSGPAKPNRLSRSFRQTQQTQQTEVDSPKSQQPDFKTPTRIPRSRAGAVFSGESPNNDSDFQQDIIWDATSPSPNRLGKRGKKHKPAVVVDISEIVNRIAPKHGRPKVAEPTLQQWIGDSAAIPCTPDVQAPKPKKKSPRPNGVDDLLKLAKQFDFNMFRQDEEDVEDLHQQSPELLFEDALDPGNDLSFSSPGNCRPAVKPTAAAGTDEQLRLDHLMEDDLDFLFDGPTQRFSGNLSQGSLASREASGKPADSSHGPTSGVTATHAKGSSAKDELVDEFEDDWDDDDLLNDSLVLEMTQNPQAFAAPKHSSTQKAAGQIRCETPAKAEVQPALTNVRRRTTFKLESNPDFSFKRLQTNPKVDYISKTANKDTLQRDPGNGISVASGSQKTWKTSNVVTSDPVSVAKFTTTASTASATKTTQHFPMPSMAVSSRGAAPAVSGLPDGDLSSFFSSDPVWDDDDDDLLCEMCEDLENQIQSGDVVSTQRTLPGGHGSNQRASPPPAARQPLAPNKPAPAGLLCAPGRLAGRPWTGGGLVSNATVAKNTSSSGPTWSSWVPPAPRGSCSKDQFTFKKPNNPVSTATSKGKCSAAEIELKKQQAMEKRRQRLQAAGNLRAPT